MLGEEAGPKRAGPLAAILGDQETTLPETATGVRAAGAASSCGRGSGGEGAMRGEEPAAPMAEPNALGGDTWHKVTSLLVLVPGGDCSRLLLQGQREQPGSHPAAWGPRSALGFI